MEKALKVFVENSIAKMDLKIRSLSIVVGVLLTMQNSAIANSLGWLTIAGTIIGTCH